MPRHVSMQFMAATVVGTLVLAGRGSCQSKPIGEPHGSSGLEG
jgi:hypothetical protein